MSSGDFAADLDHSVRTAIDAITTAALQAKARIGTSVAASVGVKLREVSPFEPSQRRGAAVAFDDVPDFETPAFEAAAPPVASAPVDDPIFLDAPMSAGATDDDGVPMWEDSF